MFVSKYTSLPPFFFPMNDHCSFIHSNSPNRIQPNAFHLVSQYTKCGVYLYNRILLSNKKEQTTDNCDIRAKPLC